MLTPPHPSLLCPPPPPPGFLDQAVHHHPGAGTLLGGGGHPPDSPAFEVGGHPRFASSEVTPPNSPATAARRHHHRRNRLAAAGSPNDSPFTGNPAASSTPTAAAALHCGPSFPGTRWAWLTPPPPPIAAWVLDPAPELEGGENAHKHLSLPKPLCCRPARLGGLRLVRRRARQRKRPCGSSTHPTAPVDLHTAACPRAAGSHARSPGRPEPARPRPRSDRDAFGGGRHVRLQLHTSSATPPPGAVLPFHSRRARGQRKTDHRLGVLAASTRRLRHHPASRVLIADKMTRHRNSHACNGAARRHRLLRVITSNQNSTRKRW